MVIGYIRHMRSMQCHQEPTSCSCLIKPADVQNNKSPRPFPLLALLLVPFACVVVALFIELQSLLDAFSCSRSFILRPTGLLLLAFPPIPARDDVKRSSKVLFGATGLAGDVVMGGDIIGPDE